MDLYQAGDSFAQLAHDSAIALISPALLRMLDDGSYAVEAPSYGELQSLCIGERFSEQPAAASCSGVLVAPSIVATAGHCLGVAPDGSADCTQNRYVLGFAVRDPDAGLAVAADDVFECKRVRGRVRSPSLSACRFDVALIELDRPARAAAAVPSIRDRPVETGEELAVIGSTAGLPIKLDRGARVIDARPEHGDFFTLSSDTFAVSSGSGVFDAQGALVGLFARGRRDYDQDGSCQRVHREDPLNAPGYEEATQIAAVRQLLATITHDEHFAARDGGQACEPAAYLETQPRASDGPRDTAGAPERSIGCVTTGVGFARGTGAAPWLMAGVFIALRGRKRMTAA